MAGNPMQMMMQLMSLMRGGGNPMNMLQQMLPGSQQPMQIMNMISGKSPAQLSEMLNNMAAQRGIDVNQLASSYGLTLPKI